MMFKLGDMQLPSGFRCSAVLLSCQRRRDTVTDGGTSSRLPGDGFPCGPGGHSIKEVLEKEISLPFRSGAGFPGSAVTCDASTAEGLAR